MKKLFVFVFCLLVLGISILAIPVKASKKPIIIYEFYGSTCVYCASLNSWFDSIENEYGQYYDLVKFEVWKNPRNSELMSKISNHFNDNATGVPYLIIGKETINGFGGTEYEKQQIINYIMKEYNKNENDRYNAIYDIIYNGSSGEINNIENIYEISGTLSTIMDLITGK